MKILRTLVIAGAVLANGAAMAQTYPDRPVRVIVPNAPGGAADLTARLMQRSLERQLGQPVAIVNVVGGGTSVGNRQVRDAAPDGLTVLAIHQALLAASALNVQDFGPDAFAPVAQIGIEYVSVIVNRRAPYQTLRDFVAAARAQPNQLRAGVQIGAINHFYFLTLASAMNLQFRYVNTGAGGPTRTALAGGHVEVAFLTPSEARPMVDSGDLTVLNIFAAERLPDFPNLPTGREQGVDLVLHNSYWWWMPRATPRDRVDRFATALRQALEDPEVRTRMLEMGIRPNFLTGAPLTTEINRQYEQMQRLARENNVTPG